MSAYNMHPVAFEFFQKFARFEYALKTTGTDGYLKVDGSGKVSPNWDKFAMSPQIAPLIENVRSNAVTKVIIDKPPLKRIEKMGWLDWSDPPGPPQNMVDVCVMLRRVRNNLFHGDKGKAGSERQLDLLTAGMEILNLMLIADPNIEQRFSDPS